MKYVNYFAVFFAMMMLGALSQAQTFTQVSAGNHTPGPIPCNGVGYQLDDGVGGGGPDRTGWWCDSDMMDLTQHTEFHFDIRFGDVTQADGITFTMHDDPAGLAALGGGGGWLGVTNSWLTGGISPSVNVEFDIFGNSTTNGDLGTQSTGTDHVAISYNGMIATPIFPATPIPLTSGFWHHMVVIWDPCNQTLTVDMDGNRIAMIQDNLVNNVFNGTANGIIWGFTSATQSRNTTHDICFTNLIQRPPICCEEQIISTQSNCNDFTFSTTSNNVNQLCQVWTVDGINVGTGSPVMTTLPPGQHVVCVNYLGTQINDSNGICCEMICDTIFVPEDTTFYCRDTITVLCGSNVHLDKAVGRCSPCDTLDNIQVGLWTDVATGNVVPNILTNVTQPGIYQQVCVDATGCIRCIKEVVVKVEKLVLSTVVNIYPNCPCSTMTSTQIDALLTSCHPGNCPGGETVFNVLEFDAFGNYVSFFVVDPLNPGLFCDGMNYLIRPANPASCCEVRLYVICSRGSVLERSIFPSEKTESNDALFMKYFPAGGEINGQSLELLPVDRMQVMPNPARDNFRLSLLSEDASGGTISIHGADGQLMEKVNIPEGQEKMMLDFITTNWASGIYVIHYHVKGKLVQAKKLTINK